MSIDVGARLRERPHTFGLSQRELARRAGVTNGLISLIEQNRVSPSVSSLKKVLDGVPMSLAEFFTLDVQSAPQVFFAAEELVEIGSDRRLVAARGRAAARAASSRCCMSATQPGAATGDDMLVASRRGGRRRGARPRRAHRRRADARARARRCLLLLERNCRIASAMSGREVCEIISRLHPADFLKSQPHDRIAPTVSATSMARARRRRRTAHAGVSSTGVSSTPPAAPPSTTSIRPPARSLGTRRGRAIQRTSIARWPARARRFARGSWAQPARRRASACCSGSPS